MGGQLQWLQSYFYFSFCLLLAKEQIEGEKVDKL